MLRLRVPRSPSCAMPFALVNVPMLVLVLNDDAVGGNARGRRREHDVADRDQLAGLDVHLQVVGEELLARRSACRARLRSRPRASGGRDRRRSARTRTASCSSREWPVPPRRARPATRRARPSGRGFELARESRREYQPRCESRQTRRSAARAADRPCRSIRTPPPGATRLRQGYGGQAVERAATAARRDSPRPERDASARISAAS